MARQRDPRRDEAYELYKLSDGEATNRAIAKKLDVPEKTISAWKSRDKWNAVLHSGDRSTANDNRSTAKKRGAPSGNKNAAGNKGGGAPKNNKNAVGHGAPLRNSNAVTHGFFRKHLPPAAMEIIDEMGQCELSLLDLLWMSIEAKFAAIMYSQKIMFVEGKDEMIKELKKEKIHKEKEPVTHDDGSITEEWIEVSGEKEYDFQFAWDRQATFLTAQSRAMAELRNLIKDYMLHSGEDDKRRLEIKKMESDLEKTKLEIDKLSHSDKAQPIEVVIKRKSERVGSSDDK